MPELPEVEAARRLLSKWIRGATIERVSATDILLSGRLGARALFADELRPETSPRNAPRLARSNANRDEAAELRAAFERRLAGQTVVRIERRGKWLKISMDDGLRLFSHLGMTGRWVRRPTGEAAAPWERLCIDLVKHGQRSSVRYVDTRRFGRLVLALHDIPDWTALGPDPLADGIEPTRLGDALVRKRRSVKEALLDQTVLAGIGNIHAIEALWKARIDPRTTTKSLRPIDVEKIAQGLTWTIARGLEERAREGDEPGYMQDADGKNPFKIYGREGEPCPRCGNPIVRTVLGGRGTYFCEHCQPTRTGRSPKSSDGAPTPGRRTPLESDATRGIARPASARRRR